MLANPRYRHRARSAYTLIELLVVIAIIAILATITLVGITKFLGKGDEVNTRKEINELSLAIESFKSEYNVDYIPSRFVLKEAYNPGDPTGVDQEHIKYLQDAFGTNVNITSTGLSTAIAALGGDPTQGYVLQGSQCLVFFLGGYNGGTWLQGFGKNKQFPFNGSSASESPAYDFPTSRITPTFQFLDPYGTPYAYMTAIKRQYDPPNFWGTPGPNFLNDVPNAMPFPYYEMFNNQPKVMAPEYYQIISAGRDKTFGPGGLVPNPNPPPAAVTQWTPGSGAYIETQPGFDDIASFHPNLLGVPLN